MIEPSFSICIPIVFIAILKARRTTWPFVTSQTWSSSLIQKDSFAASSMYRTATVSPWTQSSHYSASAGSSSPIKRRISSLRCSLGVKSTERLAIKISKSHQESSGSSRRTVRRTLRSWRGYQNTSKTEERSSRSTLRCSAALSSDTLSSLLLSQSKLWSWSKRRWLSRIWSRATELS